MGFLSTLKSIFRGMTANDGSGTPARDAGKIINDNFTEVNNALEQINNASEKSINKVGNLDNPNNVNYPDTAAVKTAVDAAEQNAKNHADGLTASFQQTSEKGQANGYAPLDANAKVPVANTYGAVDEIVEGTYIDSTTFNDTSGNPVTPGTAKIYQDTSTGNTNSGKQFRWGGSQFVEIIASPGTTDEVTEGTTNKYFTEVRVRSTILTGLDTIISSAITATDTVLSAFGKLQAQINDLANSLGKKLDKGTYTGTASDLYEHIETKETPAGAQAKADTAETSAKAYADTLFADSSSSPTRLVSFTLGWQSGFLFKPSAEWLYNDVADSDTREITASAADATYDRIDKFAVDLNLGQIILLEGVPSANPSEPEIDPVTQLEGPIILIKAGASAPDGVSGNVIWDEGGAGNWSSSPGPDFDMQSTTSPKSGTYAIEVIGLLTDGQSISLSSPSPIPVEQFKELQFAMKNKTTGGSFQVLISGNKSNGRPANQWLDAPTTFDPNNTSSYQDISLAMPFMSIVEVTKVSIVCRTEGWQYHLDDIRYVSGTETVTSGVNKEYVDEGDAELQAQIDDHEQRITALEGGSSTSPSGHHENKYADVASMLADQANQTEGSLQFVTDASGWSTVDSGWAEFEKLSTSNGAEADYRKDSEEESMDSLTEKSLKETERTYTAKQNFDGGATASTPVNPTDDSKEVVNVEYLHGKALSKTDNIKNLWTGTQAEYDALTPDANTLYFIQ